jgi:F0F1-type ATP synthase assembly protein I
MQFPRLALLARDDLREIIKALVDEDQKPDQQGETPEQKKSVWLLVARYGHIGFILPTCVFVGLLIGAALDKWLGTKSFMLVGIILGSVAGFVELIRVMVKANRE